MEKKVKISASAYRVLLLLQKLNENDCDIEDINKFFLEDPYISRLFSKDVILKYINTLRTAGYDISKPCVASKHCYKLNNAPVEIEFSEAEIKTLALLKKYAQSLHQKRLLENYHSFLKKLKRYMPNEQKEKLENCCNDLEKNNTATFTKFDHYSNLIKKLEQYIAEKQRVEIKYRIPSEEAEKLALMELQCIKYEPNDVCIICYNIITNQVNSIKISQILDIKQLPVVSKISQILCPVIFKIKGKLAEVYRPYEDERLTPPDAKGHIAVTAYSNDIESLLKRLLRYEANCEVLYPKMARDKMINLIKTTINNYQ
ncbi:MAG: hypothetical protein A2Y25_11050 [Candidatus Melainabacteria bacterium GWF2_37_15]|nr:MAG: hypothetical protein A2Y25_11050 [Candidatus Melainabacteria bacterium GWF2_37_15]